MKHTQRNNDPKNKSNKVQRQPYQGFPPVLHFPDNPEAYASRIWWTPSVRTVQLNSTEVPFKSLEIETPNPLVHTP